jgi:hypothetical protein
MAAIIPTTEPSTLTAGDTIKWLKTLADYPASAGWVLSYTFINAAGKFSATGTASGDDHYMVISAASSAAFVAGKYDWRAQVSKSGEVFTVASGRAQVLAAFSAATLDARSSLRQTLEAIEATLSGRATSATAEYEIAGRKLKFIPLPELLQFRDRLRRDVAAEDTATAVANGLADKRRIYVRFGA